MAIVQLSKSQRGVGDIELRNSSANRLWISGRDYVSSDTLPSGYVKYGVIYGFEKNGAAMLVAFDEAPQGTLWCETTGVTLPTVVSDNATTDRGRALNGTSGSYKCMNVARVASLCETGSNNTTATTHPSNAYYQGGSSAPNTKEVFESNAEAVNLYGTYEAYIAQTRPILKSDSAGVFSKRCGKANTEELATATTYTFPAATLCHDYKVNGSGDAGGEWWLPDMYELAVMMEDSHYDLHHSNSGVTTSATYWSSVANDASHAWYYSSNGMPNNRTFTNTGPRARPVTLSE